MLVRLGVALVALERPDGLLIERLLDAGLSVVAVHPNQLGQYFPLAPRFSANESLKGPPLTFHGCDAHT